MPRNGKFTKAERRQQQIGFRHSWDFTPGPDGGKEFKIRGVPTNFARSVRAKAKREKVSVRHLVLSLLQRWIDRDDPPTAVRQLVNRESE